MTKKESFDILEVIDKMEAFLRVMKISAYQKDKESVEYYFEKCYDIMFELDEVVYDGKGD